MDSIKSYLVKWNKRTDTFAKVQGAYFVLTIALFFIAGFLSLANPNLGQSFLFFTLIALLTFIANGVTWSLVRTFVVPYLEKATDRRKK